MSNLGVGQLAQRAGVAIDTVPGIGLSPLWRCGAEAAAVHPPRQGPRIHARRYSRAAVAYEVRRRSLPLYSAEEFDSVTGLGVRGQVEGRVIAIGTTTLMTEVGAEVGPLAEIAARLRLEGAAAMFVALEGRAIG